MLTDVDYAIKQLSGIGMENLNHAGQYDAADRIQRAMDALERIQAELKANSEKSA